MLTRAGEPVELDPGMVSAGLAASEELDIAVRPPGRGPVTTRNI